MMTLSQQFAELIPAGRFLLRRYVDTDTDALWRMVTLNEERLMQSFASTVTGLSAFAGTHEFITERSVVWAEGKAFTYGIWGPDTAVGLVGQITAKNVDWRVPSAEFSYFVSQSHLRVGVASAAVRALLHEAFAMHGFRRVHVRVIASNAESLGLAEKLGFRHEGLHRNEFRCGHGQLHDVHHLSITDSEYGLLQNLSW